MTRIRFAIALLVAVSTLGACGGSGDGGRPKGGASAFPVEVERVEGRQVEYTVAAKGTIEASVEVDVTARVTGVIVKVNFGQGDDVTTETVLGEIDPERFKLAREAAAAAYQRAQAELRDAQAGLKRRESGTDGERPTGIFSKEEIELWRTRVSVAEANEAERKAELDQAELDYKHAFVKPPVAGVIEEKSVMLGQWVQPGTRFARIVKTDELLLRFAVPEDEAASLKPGLAAQFTVSGSTDPLAATLVHVRAYADRTTRLVEVLAEVDPQHAGRVRPGSFALVSVTVGSNPNAATVPETAIRPSERGFLVYVIGEDNKAIERVIEIGLRTADGRVEVTKGLATGERVVTLGAEALRDGVDVSIATRRQGVEP